MVINNELTGLAQTLTAARVMRKAFPAEIEGRYLGKLAQTRAEIESALRLRYEVFNVELAAATNRKNTFGLDFDEYDAGCQHLIIIEKATGKTVGTYRINSIESARNPTGFYAYKEFCLEDLPPKVLPRALEIGRACIAREHRNSKVLFLLLKALLNYLEQSNKRYFFGCCSVFKRDPAAGTKIFRQLERDNHLHPQIRVRPRPERAFPLSGFASETDRLELPSLFNIYLKMGVKICGAPAIDREFGTIDFFVIFDRRAMNEKYRRMFFPS